MKNITLGQLIDNGLLNDVGHIVVADLTLCHIWDIKDGCLVLHINKDRFADDILLHFRLDSEVEFNGFHLRIVEDSTKEEQVLYFVNFIYIRPSNFEFKFIS